jgi:AraC-like DNA-binding protein
VFKGHSYAFARQVAFTEATGGRRARSFSQIARLLGYEGSSSFNRAFVRWTGRSQSATRNEKSFPRRDKAFSRANLRRRPQKAEDWPK